MNRQYMIESACGCSTGKFRRKNEDNFVFNGKCLHTENDGLKKPSEMSADLQEPVCFGVFDGMGGEDFGEVASYTAARTMISELKTLTDFIVPEKQFLLDACHRMNDAVYQAAQELETDRMGTTAVLAFFNSSEVYICNIGDSRAYRLRNGEFMQISQDHNEREILRERGITNQKPRLTQYLGIDPKELTIEPYVAKGDLEAGDCYLLCSDGLTDMLSNFEISCLMQENDGARDCADALVKAALDKGGKDNVTVIVCVIGE